MIMMSVYNSFLLVSGLLSMCDNFDYYFSFLDAICFAVRVK